jgi:ribosome-associated heat shock protein Hsp15
MLAAAPWDDPPMEEPAAPVRLDRWLWAARVVKTRALAAEAVKGGRVHVNGRAAKPSKEVRPGDRLEVTLGQGVRLALVVRGTAQRRGPASEAALLYEETDESRAARERQAAERRMARPMAEPGAGRPTKRDRRRWEQAAAAAARRRRG